MAKHSNPTLGRILAAGAAGGAMEVVWIGLVTAVLGIQASEVARGVATTVIPATGGTALAPWFGLFVHFLLSAGLALVFARAVGSRLHGARLVVAAVAALAAVWAFNFFVLLPAINPAFTALLPHPVTLASKLLFGVGMASVLCGEGRRPAAF